MRLFDLNIEEVLDDWEVSHALREVISNALDEQSLTGTADIGIVKVDGRWCIRDHGRGLRIEHFTLNENPEKLAATSGVIGKFGVGLKDALATFHRRGIGVSIRSSHGRFSLASESKHGFEDITTLHVAYEEGGSGFEGTEFCFDGVTDDHIEEAKSLFLRFNGEKALASTRYGDVLERSGAGARVYISGVFAAEEPTFLFSYNVTDLTPAMKKRLNRERLNVGRTTYAERIKSILREADDEPVIVRLVDAIARRSAGETPDELAWIEISQMTLTYLHERGDVLFVTEQELHRRPDILDHARADGLMIVIVTKAEKAKLREQEESGGPSVRLLESYVREFNESFEFDLVEEADLSDPERELLGIVPDLFGLIGVEATEDIPAVLVSNTMRLINDDTYGVWDPSIPAIVVKRTQMKTQRAFAATILHEAAHALTGTVDATREFENVLTDYLGRTSTEALEIGSDDRDARGSATHVR